MHKKLSKYQIKCYEDSGYIFPVPVLSEDEAKSIRLELENIESRQQHSYDKIQCNKSYLLYDWADSLVNHPRIVDAIESLIGPDIICLMTNLFIKEKDSKTYVSMHQDAAYWGVDADDVVTAWVALSPATAESGCMKVEPHSHCSLKTQVNTYARNNLLSRGQTVVADELSPQKYIHMELKPGEMSLHHFKLVHGSDTNTSNDRRIGLAIRYVAAKESVKVDKQSGLLVRGDNKSNITLEQRTHGFSERRKIEVHAKAFRLMMSSVLTPAEGAHFSEVVRLKTTKAAGFLVSYWKEITARS